MDIVTRICTTAVRLPGLGAFTGQGNGTRGAQGDRLMAVLRIIGSIATDTGNFLVDRNLAEQRWQDRCVTDTVVGHFRGADLERGRIDPDMHLAPLAAVLLAMLLRLPFAFAQQFDARAVHQQMQSRRGRHCTNSNLQRSSPPADRAVIPHRPVKSSQAQQNLGHVMSWPGAAAN